MVVGALVSIFECVESEKIRNRHLNRHLIETEKARGLENSGAGEGNRTLVISLETDRRSSFRELSRVES